MSDLTSGIRRAAAPERKPGAVVTSSSGVNQGDPTLSREPGRETIGSRSKAFPSDAGAGHKSNGWHELTDVEHRAYTETAVNLTLNAGDVLTLDPTRCQNWRVSVNGATTIIMPAPSFPEPAVARIDAPERSRLWSCVLIVDVPSGGTFPTIQGAKWSEKAAAPNVKKADGTDPEDWGGRYSFTFVLDPLLGDVIGHEGAVRV
ncbi:MULTISPECIES: hypothetical protein [unclassified Ensifer]|uniref:hypothetical protein n=1 Tax=unclassified Ensifer TaxID=2633371 RepID=UPI000812D924|nr:MULTISPECIES: hypothetical protein [unclassified Ensifer]OCP07992.1 hypothetical protein BC362_10300 [Ensifer sp. LC14]OCP10898.1 hypothetical protein BC374_17665 [Ensifer sp. LC13]OCP11556.1 hypothetical protein BBX50_18190 [Ensifer sp. LC11]OCP33375.1 hypothetical protein BC364_17080 [Ensifer sp. LC499]